MMLKTSITVKRDAREYARVRELGYDAVDYNGMCSAPGEGVFALSDREFEQELLKDRRAIEEAGLWVCQAHGVWPYDDTRPELKEMKRQAMLRSIRGAAILGTEFIVVHPAMPYGWEESPHHDADVQENIGYLESLIPYAEQCGVRIALENMPCIQLPCGRVEEQVRCIDAVDSPYLVACLDVGHSTALGYDAGDAVRMLGRRLRCLHVHDNDGKSDLHWLPYYGKTDWKRFADALCEVGYKGTISLETSVAERMPNLPESLLAEGERWLSGMAKHLARQATGAV